MDSGESVCEEFFLTTGEENQNSMMEAGGTSVSDRLSINRSVVPRRADNRRPAYQLSVRLIDTYREINRIYYAEREQRRLQDDRGGVNNEGYSDENHDYIVVEAERLNMRYSLHQRLGKGSFGQVVTATDTLSRNAEVAIKIIKSRLPFFNQAQTELELLTRLRQANCNQYNVVALLDQFVHRGHQCFVFEMLSYNLYELLKTTRFRGVSLNLIRKFSKQILIALRFLASPEIDIIHCDLKPENILLTHRNRSALKLIDFGSSCLRTRRTFTYIQSRFYRSPEILLGLSYDQKIDIWSLGCVLVEMHTGEPLFGGVDQLDQMCRIIDVLGMPPAHMLDSSPPNIIEKFFEKIDTSSIDPHIGLEGLILPLGCDISCRTCSVDGNFIYILKRFQSQRGGRDTPSMNPSGRPRSLNDIIGVNTGGPNGRRLGEQGHTPERYYEFSDFIKCMLAYDPKARISAQSALQHPYCAARNINGTSDIPSLLTDQQGSSSPTTSSFVTDNLSSLGSSIPSNLNRDETVDEDPRIVFNRGMVGAADSETSMEINQETVLSHNEEMDAVTTYIGEKRRGRGVSGSTQRIRSSSAPSSVSGSRTSGNTSYVEASDSDLSRITIMDGATDISMISSISQGVSDTSLSGPAGNMDMSQKKLSFDS